MGKSGKEAMVAGSSIQITKITEAINVTTKKMGRVLFWFDWTYGPISFIRSSLFLQEGYYHINFCNRGRMISTPYRMPTWLYLEIGRRLSLVQQVASPEDFFTRLMTVETGRKPGSRRDARNRNERPVIYEVNDLPGQGKQEEQLDAEVINETARQTGDSIF